EHFKGGQITVLNRLLKIVIRRRQLALAIKEPERALSNEIDGRRSKADLMAVEIPEDVAVNIVDRAVRFIRDNDVEKSRIEGPEDLLHRGVRGQENSLAGVRAYARGDDSDRLWQEIDEGILGLLTKLAPIAKE